MKIGDIAYAVFSNGVTKEVEIISDPYQAKAAYLREITICQFKGLRQYTIENGWSPINDSKVYVVNANLLYPTLESALVAVEIGYKQIIREYENGFRKAKQELNRVKDNIHYFRRKLKDLKFKNFKSQFLEPH